MAKTNFAAGGRRGPGGKMSRHERPRDAKGSLLFLWGYLKKYKLRLGLAIVMLLINTFASLAGSAALRPIINTYLAGDAAKAMPAAERVSGLLSGVAVMGAIFLISVVASYLQMRLMVSTTQKIITSIRTDLFDHLQKLPLRYYDSTTHGELMSRFSNDVDTLNEALQNGITSLVSCAITLVGLISLMIWTNWLLTLITLLLTPLLMLFSLSIIKRSGKYFKAQQKNLGEVNGYLEEIVSGQKVVKTFCYEHRAQEQFTQLNEQLCQSAVAAQSNAGMLMPVSRALNSCIYTIIAVTGGLLAMFAGFDAGGLVTFLSYVQHLGRPINEASNQFNAVVTAIAGTERIRDIMSQPTEPADPAGAYVLEESDGSFYWVRPGSDDRREVLGDVKFTDVTFGYVPEKTVLSDISLYAKPGQKIAFVGSTGAGKTTIINLLTRFYDISDGSITIDGIDISDIERASLRRAMAVVLQDTHLFTGTVRDNIRYGNPGISDDEVIEAAKLASAHSFILRLPHGYDTMIEGDGMNLSQGQRQLLNIARAAAANSPILILDEATSSVDTRTERHIEHGLDRLMKNRTTFVIAHRLSTVRNSNAIMVLEHGKIIERGTHDDLLSQKGRYYQLATGAAELD